ncbi:hypothetical protein [Microbispora hainanensis]|uniref:hypothetical protein n=1 Tax=Microbispora hainanensis TaxID=568844 RepID=UPI00142EAC90|nr:hypothetical protein [Microbispora hainanensis]
MASGRTFTENARRAQIVDLAVTALATLGYRQPSIARIAEPATTFSLAPRSTP